MSNYEYLERKATIYSLRGFFNALGNSPWTIIHKDGPSPPRVGRLGFGGNVTMKDGSTEPVVLDESEAKK